MQSEYYDNTHIFITDADKRLMISNSNISLSADQAAQISKENIHYSTVIQNTQWELHSVMPSSSISEDMRPMIILVYGISGLYVMLLIWMLYFFRYSIFAPISKLSRFMQHMPDAQGKMRLEINSSNEFGMMMRIMNDMLDALDAKSQQIIDNETRILKGETARQQMEIIAYRNQINPHFLYNTLDCIRGIAFMHHSNEIVEICKSLSRMFRYAVSGGDTATVKEEIEYVGFYATIIGYRFSNRISITTDASDDVLECKTIKMLLQPLVENSITHGIKNMGKDGIINVIVKRDGCKLIFIVEDNGCCIDIEEVNRLLGDDTNDNRGFAIKNVNDRIKLFFGNDYGLEFMKNGKWTTAIVSQPYRKEEIFNDKDIAD
jgi:two-component system sensor histidine kinase YesM